MEKVKEGYRYFIGNKCLHFTIYKASEVYFVVRSFSGKADEYVGPAYDNYKDAFQKMLELEKGASILVKGGKR